MPNVSAVYIGIGSLSMEGKIETPLTKAGFLGARRRFAMKFYLV